MKPRRILGILLLCLGSLVSRTSVQAEAAKGFEGTWEGSVLYQAGQFEIDLLVDLARDQKGNWRGTMTLPLHNVYYRLLYSVKVDGDKIVFQYNGDTANHIYTGTLSPAGDKITGKHGPDDDAPFELHRKAVSPPPPRSELRDLTSNELRSLFNQDAGKIRLVMLLSPACFNCRMGARLIERYVLDQFDSDAIRAYVVWEPILDRDDRKAAQVASVLMADPRVTQFWGGDHSVGNAFKTLLGFTDSPAWDVYVLYPPDAKWGEAPPEPAYFMHQLSELPKERLLNAMELASRVKALVGGKAEGNGAAPGGGVVTGEIKGGHLLF